MVKSKRRINIRDIFLGLQEQMRSKLTLNRKILTHPVAKGSASELEWIDMLSAYLPSRYRADRAFIIDCDGHVSQQIDIVIYDRHYSPFILKRNGSTYIPAESVYAVVEVKPTLNMANISYAAIKAASVRDLKRTTAPIVHAGGKIDKPKEPFGILSGILTIDGKCSDSLKNKLSKLSAKRFIHFGCSLDHAAFWFKKNEKGIDVFEKSAKEEALIFFFLNLLEELQKLGTVSAIDLKAYITAINKK
ncbi:MAG: hypothetical protein KKC80_06785 [Candidatus Margulisbacteria bacterium]|nr:hypothetical protein [Candidatus Margulisiibacteriota bacterium]MBU1617510.1 hypothetical protein [Candidatus Margulisiibacteriota bacterium]